VGPAPTPVVRASGGPTETLALGALLGAALARGDCLGLDGPLGAGKTVFVRGLVQGAGAADRVRSPTFVLHAVYPGPLTVHHLDLYRLDEGVDLRTLGVEELMETGAVVVEWAERADRGWFTARCRIEPAGGDRRRIRLDAPDRLLRALRLPEAPR